MVVAVASTACQRRPVVRERPGLDGLRAQLEAIRDGAPAALRVPRADWAPLVTASYRAHYDGYAAAFVPVAIGPGPVTTRWQYADDRTLSAAQRRERIALPVGRPGLIATVDGRDLAPVFVFDHGHWRALTGLDALTRAAIGDPQCALAYRLAADGTCMELAAPIASAALDGDVARLAIACGRLTALGCGSVGAPP